MADVEPVDNPFRLTPGLRLRHWDNDILVYDPARGNTHLLCGPAATLLHAIEHGEAVDIDTDSHALVDQLHGLGLIEQVGF
ncbi:hypothetical protein [Thiohalophilus sp.]|uniref:hypothetical protein n=1 Tax=Thiohalophilus sp. TaxID=3028392 RepID=UPI002ACD31D5|nr:hypothetical protein [Thiohalophilus sp.]MDZ7803445.1 hypothetical protein [Thiohalophilus sp.]